MRLAAHEMIFADRNDAGRQLAEIVKGHELENPLVLALPRGGVVVAAEVAEALNAPLDLAVAKKIGHPQNPEAAVGAVSEDGQVYLDDRGAELVDPIWLEKETVRKVQDARQLRVEYTGEADPPSLYDRAAILVDDGIATGSTMFAAIMSARARGAKRVIVAVPVGPPSTLKKLKNYADEVIAVAAPEFLYAVGAHYEDFRQVTDREVLSILEKHRKKAI